MNSVQLRALPAEDLVVLSAAGDRRAFGELYDRTAARMLGLATRLVVDRAIAEEVVQEAFLEAWQRAARFDPERGAAASWLLTITRTRAIDRIRSEQAARDRMMRIGMLEHEETTEDVADSVERAAMSEWTVNALEQLTARQSEALRLFYDGYTHREIAERLGVPQNTVKTRVRDGLGRLRVNMQAA